MRSSDNTDKLFAALALFQGDVTNPPREADNPFYRNKYTTLDAMISHVRPALSKHGLSVIQMPCSGPDGIGVITTLCHASGQYVQSDPYYLKLSKQDAQAGGSAITYARRYAYAAILGIASDSDDDDGCDASAKEQPKKPAPQQPTQEPKPEPAPRQETARDIKSEIAASIKKYMARYGMDNKEFAAIRADLIGKGLATDMPSYQMTMEQFNAFMGEMEREAQARYGDIDRESA